MIDNINENKMDLNVNFIKSVLSLFSEMQGNGISLVYLGNSIMKLQKCLLPWQSLTWKERRKIDM